MTDNDKAATFIWKPEDGCQCEGCIGYEHNLHDRSVITPPNMSDPRNYMKALELLYARGYFVALTPCHEFDAWGLKIEDRGDFEPILKETPLESSPSKAAIKGLAALYDAEHSK